MRIERLGKRAMFIIKAVSLEDAPGWVVANLDKFMREHFPDYVCVPVMGNSFFADGPSWNRTTYVDHLLEIRFTIKEEERSSKEPKLCEMLAELCRREEDSIYLEIGDEAMTVRRG